MCALKLISSLSSGSEASRDRVVCGDNVTVLDRLAGELSGAVRCAYLDPPYGNNERYTHYDDRWRRSEWLAGMGRILGRLPALMRRDGSVWISIDDNELHYLKVLADEVLGRGKFVTTIVWEHRRSRENRRTFSNNHEYLLVYAMDPDAFRASRNKLPASADLLSRYRNPDEDPRGLWQSVSLTAQDGHSTASQHYVLVTPEGQVHVPPKGRCWVLAEDRMQALIADHRVWFGQRGTGVPRLKRYLCEASTTMTPSTLWTADEVGTTTSAKRPVMGLLPNEPVFDTPKPEQLLRRVLGIASDPGDLILDPYLGSGTTAAVAMKMGRQWLGIESGDHAATHCAERLRRVVAGEPGGISPAEGWAGGGGFRFERLTDSVVDLAA